MAAIVEPVAFRNFAYGGLSRDRGPENVVGRRCPANPSDSQRGWTCSREARGGLPVPQVERERKGGLAAKYAGR